MEKSFSVPHATFNSPEEELHFLRAQVLEKEKQLESAEKNVERDTFVSEYIDSYKKIPPHEVLTPEHELHQKHIDAIVLDLSPEQHDSNMEELITILHNKGIRNALSVVEAMNDPHLEDDFHRFLVEYIKKGFLMSGLEKAGTLMKSLKHTLFEIQLPEFSKEQKEKPLKEIVSIMEQFYAGMSTITQADPEAYFTLEIAKANGSEEFVFYASVPDDKCDLFEKQLISIFPDAKIKVLQDDYNIFNGQGESVGSYAQFTASEALPLKTYEAFDADPIHVLLNAFSKIQKQGEGASVQIVVQPRGNYYLKRYTDALEKIQKGESSKKALDIQHGFFGQFLKEAKEVLFEGSKKKDEKNEVRIDEKVVEQLKSKISAPVVATNIRVIASADTKLRATEILSDIESAFGQFQNTLGNAFTFKRCEDRKLKTLFREFSFRSFSGEALVPLNTKELSTLMHFPTNVSHVAPQLKKSKAATAGAPMDIPTSGITLGVNKHRNADTVIHISPEDRLRHMYVIGQTGTGKTTFLKNMIIQDIQNGEGVCLIDPHGSDIVDVLANIPKERYEDVVYFDPSNTERPMALNMLEYDVRFPEQKTFVVNEMLAIFNKLFDMKTAGGPMFEQYFRNAVMLVLEDPETGSTLLDVSRVLVNKEYRTLKLSHCKNPIVVQFWKEVAEKAGGEGALQNIVPYITSKFDVFLSNDIMRPVVAQEKSSFNFREIMDNKKILLVNLSKGRLGDINSSLLGLILVGKLLMAALSRVDGGKDLPPFYLYIDEFQNITTDSIATILSEARKYKLSLTIAHQFIAQLEDNIKDAVFGNVGSMAVFRVGAEDSEFLEKQFAPTFTASDIMNLDNHNAYLKILAGGRPTKPFNIEKIAFPPNGHPEAIADIKQLSYLKYGGDRATIEASIMEKYKKPEPVAPKV